MPVLAATRMGLFERDGEAVAVESCDVVFCSFETLRDELKTQLKGRSRQSSSAGDLAPHATMSGSPLGVLGFWRIVLDEAQIVSNTASHAAMMASALWRRHAWVRPRAQPLRSPRLLADARPPALPPCRRL